MRLLGHEGGRAHDHVAPVVCEEGALPVELLDARRHAHNDVLQLQEPPKCLVPNPLANLELVGGQALVGVDFQKGFLHIPTSWW